MSTSDAPLSTDQYVTEKTIREQQAEIARLRDALTTIKHRVRDLADNSRFVIGSARWQIGQDMKVTLLVLEDALGSSDSAGEKP